MTVDNYDRDSRSVTLHNILGASNVDFWVVFMEQLHRSNDIGITGHYKSISSKYLFKDEIQFKHGDARGFKSFSS